MSKKNVFEKLRQGWKKVGPGLITGASDDDPSGIATYSQAGAVFGLSLLWTALITYPLMFAIQAMCARIGILNSSGLIGVIRKYYSSYLVWLTLTLIVPAIIFNIAADLSSMSSVVHLGIPWIPKFVFDTLIVLISIIFIFFFRYEVISNIFKVCCLALLGYFIVPFLVNENWWEVFYAAFIPQFILDKEFIYLFVAILGTTISPYLFFWQSSMSHEDKQQDISVTKKTAIQWMKLDVNLGMMASNLAMFFIILATATVLHNNGITKINTVEDAALALKPIAGDFAFVIFSIGVFGVGFLSISVLSGCVGYMFAECFKWEHGLNKIPKEAPGFYTVIGISLLMALIINYVGIDPIESLILTAILYGVLTPPILAIILHICNNEKIMGEHVNSFFYNILGGFTFILMTFSALCLGFMYFLT